MSIIAKEKFRSDYKAPEFTITTLDLDVTLADHATLVVATSRVEKQGKHQDPLVLDGENMILKSVLVDQKPVTYQQTEHQLIIDNLPDSFELCITTQIDPAGNSALEGLYKSGPAFCTQCEAEGFRRITYYLDRPDVLARFTTKITGDKKLYPYMLSNGNCVAKGDNADGTHWVQWQDPFPKPCYLFALVAGDFDVLHDTYKTKSGRDVKLELFVDLGKKSRGEHAMECIKRSMKWDEERFGLEYDLDIFMVVAVSFFNMGAMENKGLNIFNDKYVLADAESATDADYFDIERVIGHEYFHNWTGDRVTCRDWFQLSLKEGLTVFRDQEFSSDLGSRVINRIHNVKTIRGPQFAEDAGPMSHPIRPDAVMEMNNFYTVTVYEKGSEVIRMMHTLLGEDKFQAGMRLYFERHDGHAVTCDDFVQAMEDASGVDLGQFRRWYSQSGTPVLDVTDHYDAAKQQYSLTVRQHTPATAEQKEKLPLHIPLSVALYSQQGTYLGDQFDQVLSLKEAEQTFTFDQVTEKPIIALLQDFSAPVRLNFDYSDNDLLVLMKFSRNEFSRWDATQMLINKYVRLNIANFQNKQEMVLPDAMLAAFADILNNKDWDKSLIAEMLRIPSEVAMAELSDQIDIDAIHAVKRFMEKTIASRLHQTFLITYANNRTGAYSLDPIDVAKRDLLSVCLHYLAVNGNGDDEALVMSHYRAADNMTDQLAAMEAAKAGELPLFATMLAEFDAKWHQDGLVMDKWFRMQATSPSAHCLQTVKSLLKHPTFSMQNPNRLRALVGTFSAANPYAFHAADGAGYAFLGDILNELNTANPQVAARLITPMLQYRRFDQNRQDLIRAQLEKLQARADLSRDLYEKVTRALNQ